MYSISRYLIGGFVMLTIIIIAFCSSIRGCLSKYDERYTLSPVLYFKKDNKEILFSLVRYNETSSYSSEQGIVTKTFDNYYFIQANNASTGEKISGSKIKKRTENKAVDAAIIGATEKEVWVFIDGLLAFDAFTLQQVANTKIIENKNPLLKGKLPGESQYYNFDNENKNISFTARDGSLWLLDTKTLKATPKELSGKKEVSNDDAAFQSRLKSLQRINTGFGEMSINQDTANGQWIVLYSADEMEKLQEQVSFTGAYGQDVRRQLFTTHYKTLPETNSRTNKLIFKKAEPAEYFLDGGLLVNKKTAKVIRLNNPDSYLVIYKSQIGVSGEIMLCRLTENGNTIWKVNTGLTNWIDWNNLDNRILIFGGNSNLMSSSNCNLLLSIDLHSGQVHSYDYLTDKSNQSKN